MLFGKEHPYDHDMSLPLYIKGPGVPAGTTLLHPTNHLDITATVVELAGATPSGPALDGKSFAAALTSTPVAPEDWRTFSFTEHFSNANTWWSIRRPLQADRTKFNHWCQEDEEVFHLDADQWEMSNVVGTPSGAALAAKELALAVTLGSCKGAAECGAPKPAGRVPKKPLMCKNVTKGETWAGYD